MRYLAILILTLSSLVSFGQDLKGRFILSRINTLADTLLDPPVGYGGLRFNRFHSPPQWQLSTGTGWTNLSGSGGVSSCRPAGHQYTSSHTLSLTDINTCNNMGVIRMVPSAAVNLTIPLHASVAFEQWTQIGVTNEGTDTVTVVCTGGVTGNPTTIEIPPQGAALLVNADGANTWDLVGGGSGGSFALTDGQATTANGTGVDQGGSITQNIDIDDPAGTHSFTYGGVNPLAGFVVNVNGLSRLTADDGVGGYSNISASNSQAEIQGAGSGGVLISGESTDTPSIADVTITSQHNGIDVTANDGHVLIQADTININPTTGLKINLDPGTANDVLTSHGAGTPPTWESGGSTLTDGNATTANGSAADLGGTATAPIDIDLDGNSFTIKDGATDNYSISGGVHSVGGAELTATMTGSGSDIAALELLPGVGGINLSNITTFSANEISNSFTVNNGHASLVSNNTTDDTWAEIQTGSGLVSTNGAIDFLFGSSASHTSKFGIAYNGAIRLTGGNLGTSGQVLTSAGSGSAAVWSTPVFSGNFSQVGTATTTFTVTIGATQANNTYEVVLTSTSLLGMTAYYISAKTTTTFDVTYSTGLTGTVTFDWILRP